AEDGIRDGHVTGVQTCALPIYMLRQRVNMKSILKKFRQISTERMAQNPASLLRSGKTIPLAIRWKTWCRSIPKIGIMLLCMRKRSEERRVGKECRYQEATEERK